MALKLIFIMKLEDLHILQGVIRQFIYIFAIPCLLAIQYKHLYRAHFVCKASLCFEVCDSQREMFYHKRVSIYKLYFAEYMNREYFSLVCKQNHNVE